MPLEKGCPSCRVTGKPEVVPVKKSGWMNCGAKGHCSLSDFLELRFSGAE